jgi:hypothetical protein
MPYSKLSPFTHFRNKKWDKYSKKMMREWFKCLDLVHGAFGGQVLGQVLARFQEPLPVVLPVDS